MTPPSNDLPTWSLPSFSGNSFFGSSVPNLDKIQADLERKLLNAQSEEEVYQIIEDTIRPILADPRMQADCDRVVKEMKSEQAKMEKWVASGKNIYAYPIDEAQQLTKELQICAIAQQEGYISLSP